MRTGLETREELFAVMEQIAEERETARPIVQELVASGRSIDDIEIPEGWRTAGMVLELCETAGTLLESDPTLNLSLAHLALTVSANVRDSYSGVVTGFSDFRCWREIALVHCQIGSYATSINAHASAEKQCVNEPALAQDAAIARQCRGFVKTFLEEYEESTQLIEEAGTVLREFGDELRLAKGELVKGNMHLYCGEFELSRLKYESLSAIFQRYSDLHSLGVLYNNLGIAYAWLGRNSDAVMAFEHAREIFSDLEMPSEIDRADWGLATVLETTGECGKAASLLKRLHGSFLKHQMPYQAGLIALHLADVLSADERRPEARLALDEAIHDFQIAGADPQTIGRITRLRKLLPRSRRPQRAIKELRTDLKRYQPERGLTLNLDERDY
ncbi:MAG: tetratricopeptide repeat protein [Acidobacteriota bacterium]|nr:tetratricopeptide repeat protein [Acidobacteriota bacterium]